MLIRIKNYFLKLRAKYRTRNLYLEKNIHLSRETQFDGNNRVCANTSFRKSKLGEFSYIGWHSNLNHTKIGKFCSIGPHVEVVLGTHPVDTFVSTHPIFYSAKKQCGKTFVGKTCFEELEYLDSQYCVVIGNDVWVGFGAIILQGVTIGNGAIVCAGSLVTQDVEAYSVVGGVPAKHLKYRFDRDTRNRIAQSTWWDRDIEWIQKNLQQFYHPEEFLKDASA